LHGVDLSSVDFTNVRMTGDNFSNRL